MKSDFFNVFEETTKEVVTEIPKTNVTINEDSNVDVDEIEEPTPPEIKEVDKEFVPISKYEELVKRISALESAGSEEE